MFDNESRYCFHLITYIHSYMLGVDMPHPVISMKVVAGLDYTGMYYFVVVVAAALQEHPESSSQLKRNIIILKISALLLRLAYLYALNYKGRFRQQTDHKLCLMKSPLYFHTLLVVVDNVDIVFIYQCFNNHLLIKIVIIIIMDIRFK